MDFISNRKPQVQAMLKDLGVDSVLDLFSEVPKTLLQDPPREDDGLSEFEGIQLMENLAKKNTFAEMENYLGAGAYEHHIPSYADAICRLPGFLTAYTPYQAEASQGMLQVIFEFQSAICALTGMDVSNAGMYDGASACAEALLMTLRAQRKRKEILIAEGLHPHYRAVVEQYLAHQEVTIQTIPSLPDGSLDHQFAKEHMSEKTAAILLQQSNVFGVVEDLSGLIQEAKNQDVMSVVCANPLVYGLYQTPGEMGADIAVGDCQPLGIPLQFGGPYVGYMATRSQFVRQMPGRIVGESVDEEGKRAFVLTLQAREQHIRREKATSNICSNQSLAALGSLLVILWYGPQGLRDLALTNYQRAMYLKTALEGIPGFKPLQGKGLLNEFVVEVDAPMDQVLSHFQSQGIAAGVPLGRFFPERKQELLIAVTETKSVEQLDRYCEVAREVRR